MIIDCDTHVIPKDAFDYIESDLNAKRPVFRFDEYGHYFTCEFPGDPLRRGDVVFWRNPCGAKWL